MQRNFILTDLMKTGDHQKLEAFVSMHSLKGQTFDMTGEYYSLHKFDLDQYHRRFAIIDVRARNSIFAGNSEFNFEIHNRIKLLRQKGFVFIQATPWESLHNIISEQLYPVLDIDHLKWSGGVSWFWSYMYLKHKDKKYDFDHKEKLYDFLYLNKFTRGHRQRLFDMIEPLLGNSLYTNWEKDIKLPIEYELPWAQNYPEKGLDQDIYEKPYNATKFSLISETNDTNGEVFLTEKIWKAVMAKHIFVIHGNLNYLKTFRSLGFKTFSDYFDEGYDTEMHKKTRMEKIKQTCISLQSMDWEDLYKQTQALRQHNYETFFDREKLSVQVNKTLELFLEFADGSQVPSRES